MGGIFVAVIMLIAIAVIFFFVKGVKVIKQGEIGIVERLGKVKGTIDPGMNFVNPLID